MNPAPRIVELDAATRVEALTRAYAGWPAAGRPASGAGAGLLHAFAHIADTVAERVNRVPDKNLLAFLDLVGVRPEPPQTARVPLTFTLAAGATNDVVVPARTRVAAVTGPGEGDPPIFETERDLVATATRLLYVRTRDPAGDRYADRGAGEVTFGAFDAATWIDHRLYVAHDELFGLAEQFDIGVQAAGLTANALWPWMLHWERWDGLRWAPHDARVERRAPDTVEILLTAMPAIPRSTVAGLTNRWLRARLQTSIPRLGAGADTAPVVRRVGLAPDALRANNEAAEGGRVAPFLTNKRLLMRCDETLSKPGAQVTVTVRLDPAVQPQPSSDLRLRWQWFDGGWKTLGESTPTTATGVTDTTKALSVDGSVSFTVPIGVTVPAQTEARWLLVEIVAGGYGATPPVLASLEFGYDWPRPRVKAPFVWAHLQRADRLLDEAFASAAPVDLSKDFLPFGPRPVAGDACYLGCDDAFTPPRSSVTLAVTLTTPPGSSANATPPPASAQHDLLLRWEYFDAVTARWTTLGESGQGKTGAATWPLVDTTEAFTKNGSVAFPLPATMGAVEANGVTRRWLRVRVARGDYNATTTVSGVDVLTPRPPSISSVTASYRYVSPAPMPADVVLTENDFSVSVPAPATNGLLTPFSPSGDEEPTLYVGFDRPFSNQAVSLYVGVEDVAVPAGGLRGTLGGGPAVVVWEFWSGEIGDWSRLETRDETRAFTRRGLVTFVGPPALAPSVEFGRRAHWLRARWVRGSYLRRPVLERVATNTTWASHWTTIENEVVGSSTARRDQVFRTSRSPVLPSQRVEVREVEGGSWTAWSEVVDFHGSGPTDRHYMLDRVVGELRFGDGVKGRIPPRGRENVRLARFRTGGGEAGNRATGAVSRLLSTLSYIDSVTNAEPATGGIDAEGTDAFVERGPRMLRHRGRAVVASDFEDLAREASGAVARATAITGRTREESGAVGVVIVPAGTDARLAPTAELVERVDDHLRARSGATFDLWVAGPGWVRVDVDAEVVPTGLELATDVENAVRARVREFLHPLTGGPGDGWPLGRRIFRSDLLPVVEGTRGVDHVRTLRVSEATTDAAPAQDAFLVYSGEHRIRVVGGD